MRQLINEIFFKIRTWFAGARNKITKNPKMENIEKSALETSYGEMADFNAQQLAEAFANEASLEHRKGVSVESVDTQNTSNLDNEAFPNCDLADDEKKAETTEDEYQQDLNAGGPRLR